MQGGATRLKCPQLWRRRHQRGRARSSAQVPSNLGLQGGLHTSAVAELAVPGSKIYLSKATISLSRPTWAQQAWSLLLHRLWCSPQCWCPHYLDHQSGKSLRKEGKAGKGRSNIQECSLQSCLCTRRVSCSSLLSNRSWWFVPLHACWEKETTNDFFRVKSSL